MSVKYPTNLATRFAAIAVIGPTPVNWSYRPDPLIGDVSTKRTLAAIPVTDLESDGDRQKKRAD